jgi:hypothetical protein
LNQTEPNAGSDAELQEYFSSNCECTLANHYLYQLDDFISKASNSQNVPEDSKKEAEKAVGFFHLGTSPAFDKEVERLGKTNESLHCPKFLVNASTIFSKAEKFAEELEFYWSANLKIKIEMLKIHEYKPVCKNLFRPPSTVEPITEKNIKNANIEDLFVSVKSIGGLIQSGGFNKSTPKMGYNSWLDIKKTILAEKIVGAIVDRSKEFLDNVPQKKAQQEELFQCLDCAAETVLLWCSLEKVYKDKIDEGGSLKPIVPNFKLVIHGPYTNTQAIVEKLQSNQPQRQSVTMALNGFRRQKEEYQAAKEALRL